MNMNRGNLNEELLPFKQMVNTGKQKRNLT